MPNYVSTYVTLPTTALNAAAPNGFKLNHLLPVPEMNRNDIISEPFSNVDEIINGHETSAHIQKTNMQMYGQSTYTDMKRYLHGTKWEASDSLYINNNGSTDTTVCFTTPWSPPVKPLCNLSNYTNEVVLAVSVDEAPNYVDIRMFQKGVVILDLCLAPKTIDIYGKQFFESEGCEIEPLSLDYFRYLEGKKYTFRDYLLESNDSNKDYTLPKVASMCETIGYLAGGGKLIATTLHKILTPYVNFLLTNTTVVTVIDHTGLTSKEEVQAQLFMINRELKTIQGSGTPPHNSIIPIVLYEGTISNAMVRYDPKLKAFIYEGISLCYKKGVKLSKELLEMAEPKPSGVFKFKIGDVILEDVVEVCNLINKVWLSNIFYKDTFSIINNDTLKPIFNSDIKELDKLKKVIQHKRGITRLNLDIQLGELIVNVN